MMTDRALRIAIGLVGALMLVVTLRNWIDPSVLGANLGFAATNTLGHASLRADVGGFFGVAGLFSFGAAVRDDHRLLTAPLFLMIFALLGRTIALFAVPFDVVLVPPMVVEAGMVALFAVGRSRLG